MKRPLPAFLFGGASLLFGAGILGAAIGVPQARCGETAPEWIRGGAAPSRPGYLREIWTFSPVLPTRPVLPADPGDGGKGVFAPRAVSEGDTVRAAPCSVLYLPRGPAALGLLRGTGVALFRGGRELLPGEEYRLHEGEGRVEFPVPLDSMETVTVQFERSPLLPFPEGRVYRREDVPVRGRPAALEAGAGESGSPGLSGNAPFAAPGPAAAPGAAGSAAPDEEYGLDYGGSKSFLVSVGDGGGLSLDQSLVLDVKGRLSEDMFLEGHLSDQNLPLQPEGNTATLRELDDVHIRLYGARYSLLLGDHLLRLGLPGWDALEVKVQGASGSLSRAGYLGRFSLSGSRGQYGSDTLRGVDGQQRGYYLRAPGRGFVTVLSGTERLYREGLLLVRGTHYTIDYNQGRIDFLNNLIVTSEDRFSAEFQFADQDYAQNLYGAEVSDSAGAFRWSLRSLWERDNAERPLSFLLTEEDRARLARAGDSVLGLAPGSPSPALPDTGLSDSLASSRPLAAPMELSSQGLRLAYARPEGFSAVLDGLLSGNDRNLLSSRDDEDNWGSAAGLEAAQVLGRPFGAGGFGRWEGRYALLRRSPDFTSFHQLLDPVAFSEAWNLPVRTGERDFTSQSLRVSNRVHRLLLLKGERARAEGRLRQGPVSAGGSAPGTGPSPGGAGPTPPPGGGEFPPGNDPGPGEGPGPEAASDRLVGGAEVGEERLLFHLESAAIRARLPAARDNYRQEGGYRTRYRGFDHSLRLERNEWLAEAAGRPRPLARTERREGEAFLKIPALPGGLEPEFTVDASETRSDFDAEAAALRDSSRGYGYTQRWRLWGTGPWHGDLFHSYRRSELYRTARDEAAESRDFHLFEWNNQVAGPRSAFAVNSSYRVNRSAEFPLIDDFRRVPAGSGDYVYDSLFGVFHPAETGGDFILYGYRRDTSASRLPFQEVFFRNSVDLSPGRLGYALKGVLADITVGAETEQTAQDSSGSPSLLPPFRDADIDRSRSGRLRYEPFLRWSPEAGKSTLNLSLLRDYARTSGYAAARERVLRQEASFERIHSDRWESRLDAARERRERLPLGPAPGGGLENRILSGGPAVTRRLPHLFALTAACLVEDVEGASPLGILDLNGYRPRLRLEKSGLWQGRIFAEYGIVHLFGRGDPTYFATGGYAKGLTQRFEAGAHFKAAGNLYGDISYILREEPGGRPLGQKLSGEVRAVF